MQLTLTRPPLYPFAVTAALVIGAYADTYAPLSWVLRPILVSWALVGLIVVMTWALTRSWHTAGLVALLMLVAVWQPIVSISVGITLVLIAIVRRARAAPFALAPITRGLNILTLAWLVVAVVLAVPVAFRPTPTVAVPPLEASVDERLNFDLLLLDGYARADTLAEWGFDNSAFLDELERRGFEVEADAQTSYPLTTQTLLSMWTMHHLEELPFDPPTAGVEQQRTMRQLIDAMPAAQEMRRIGYTTTVITADAAETAMMGADRHIDTGQPNEFEHHLMRLTGARDALDALVPSQWNDWKADRTVDNLAALRAVAAERSPEPRLVVMHVLAPHAPFVFDADGNRVTPPECITDKCGTGQGSLDDYQITIDEYAPLYTGHLAYINQLVLETLDSVIAHDPEAVVVVFSDHGARADASDQDEWYRTLFAARTPGQPGLYRGNGGPAGIFHGLWRGYFGVNVEWPARVQYAWGEDGSLVVWQR